MKRRFRAVPGKGIVASTVVASLSNWPRDHYFWDFEIPEDMEAFEEAQELYLNDIELSVADSLNLFLEPSVQGSRGGMFVYDESGADNDTIEVDYRNWCIDEISMAASSSSPEKFRAAFEAYLESLMEDAGWSRT